MNIERILEPLQKVKRTGDNEFIACCPAHDDRSPSLTLKELSDGRILIHCFAGCGGHEIMQSIGMTLDDLYPDGALGELKGWHQTTNQMRSQRKAKKRANNILEIASMKLDDLTPSQLDEVRRARQAVKG